MVQKFDEDVAKEKARQKAFKDKKIQVLALADHLEEADLEYANIQDLLFRISNQLAEIIKKNA